MSSVNSCRIYRAGFVRGARRSRRIRDRPRAHWDSRGREPHRQSRALRSQVNAAQDPLTRYVNRVEREQVRAAIQQLPLPFREIILLREYEELSYQEIAALLDCPPGTVMSRLARARSKLRDLLSGGQMTPRVEQMRSAGQMGRRHEHEIGFEPESSSDNKPRRREYFVTSCV